MVPITHVLMIVILIFLFYLFIRNLCVFKIREKFVDLASCEAQKII